jgi:uncharacterized membrane protein YkoI
MKEDGMSDRGARRIVLALAVAALNIACGHPEQRVVDQYFNAVNQGDTQTLASFAAVKFDKKVDQWKIAGASAEQRTPVQLPNLVAKVTELELALADNKKAYNAYFLEHPKEVDQVRDLLKKEGAKIPPNLQPHATEWEKFTQKEKELKKTLAEAKDTVEREKHSMTLSLGNLEDLETLTGELVTKDLDLVLTIGGTPKNYTMALRKYDAKGAAGAARVVSRWVVHSLLEKA